MPNQRARASTWALWILGSRSSCVVGRCPVPRSVLSLSDLYPLDASGTAHWQNVSRHCPASPGECLIAPNWERLPGRELKIPGRSQDRGAQHPGEALKLVGRLPQQVSGRASLSRCQAERGVFRAGGRSELQPKQALSSALPALGSSSAFRERAMRLSSPAPGGAVRTTAFLPWFLDHS